MKEIKLHLGYAGFCYAKENDAIRDGKRRKIKFQALWGLIKHPESGYILFDTGYTERFYKETNRFPNKIYALITKVVVTKDDTVKSQLKASGIDPKEIKTVFISHFHADHVAGLMDFPDAKIITSKAALDYTLGLKRAFAFSKGVLKGLLPEDIRARVKYIEDAKSFQDPILGDGYDILGDMSILAYNLTGHARGQYGIVVKTERKQYFLIADASWLKRSHEEYILPNPIVKLFFDSWSEFKSSLMRVHLYYKEHKDVLIVPTHCSETTDPLITKTVDFERL